MPPEQAAANVASIRQMIAQSDAWRQIQAPGAATQDQQKAR
jgi:Flp pilus assembly protein TadD